MSELMKWRRSDKIGLKKFLKQPKLKWWQAGIIAGVGGAGLLGIFYYQGFPAYVTCPAPAGFWLWCLFWLYFQFLTPFIIGGLALAYLIRFLRKKKQ
ncbi:MAG: hypothetical protein COY66_01850 [Candidatus Kerfeldbacteria bacterium CG_4_10_14_0_8_um_filter_42_10]|uniref:Uncharacterized protein n=1 Tax=Candidatus Kerfeldbacteria bacterium CG_4_10_14_0_8_um_filter_42_10 TaxID=2014248 RepID=A0A2M7RKS6_9BACT|nr:MAG: hypothetical protein COY66_01850 [Candidatus Kerfeldbacteria bacterium CG_4_10_14_0_8_um_filter_42_10]